MIFYGVKITCGFSIKWYNSVASLKHLHHGENFKRFTRNLGASQFIFNLIIHYLVLNVEKPKGKEGIGQFTSRTYNYR